VRAVVQRVSSASVEVAGECRAAIGRGLVVLVGVGCEDEPADAVALAAKVAGLRIFNDDSGAMNKDLKEVAGAVLAVSQFTLYGDARKGRRPSFTAAAKPEQAKPLFDAFIRHLREAGLAVETGVFGARMRVQLVNEGPVTILLDSRKVF
jgi:D-tyrosyl-tRNA(Tyr) deacylase